MRSVLIIDGDLDFAESIADMLRPHGYSTHVVNTPARAVAALREPPSGIPALPVALIERRLGGEVAGVDLIPRLRVEQPELVFVLMAADLDRPTALTALRRGAYDYFDKASDPSALLAVLDRCFGRVELQREREAACEALRTAKEKAEAASRLKSGFLATMSHELRTPLNAIIGFADMMRHEVLGTLGNEQYRAYASDIHDSGTHLLQIINDFLDLSKAEFGKLELHEEVFDLRKTIRSVRHLTGSSIRAAGLSDSFELAADLPLLRADSGKTKQVLLNLVTNAVKFTPAGGRIKVDGGFEPASGLTLAVTDNGIGIAPADIDRVLEPFEQVNSSITRQHQGTGLGLPLVKAIMELHGGSIEITSEIRVGTRVRVTFPPERAVLGPSAPKSRSAAA
ncbi:MAG TPA: ATP-binding protein [Stellaceae bacterium]|nr:ATP-binding protein [Stellaceae bacterium]